MMTTNPAVCGGLQHTWHEDDEELGLQMKPFTRDESGQLKRMDSGIPVMSQPALTQSAQGFLPFIHNLNSMTFAPKHVKPLPPLEV